MLEAFDIKVSKPAFLVCSVEWHCHSCSSPDLGLGYEYVSLCEYSGTSFLTGHEAKGCQRALLSVPLPHQPCPEALAKECHCHVLKPIESFVWDLVALKYVLCNCKYLISSALKSPSERLISFLRKAGMQVDCKYRNIMGHLE